ncbi:cache domain-containing protein [Thiomicrorhabdus indica]|uniref:cache domain-containing protein n=1 Tax=Thiomicrorhabdus indica TaxID=2267253 RepID=UPI00102D7179|nr:cache domain-containing protein [Thiomicrorhabdus indica]
MKEFSNQQIKQFNEYLPGVKSYLDALEHQDLWWTTVAMVGKINNENIDPQLLVSVVETQKEFQNLRDIMMQSLVNRYLNQASSEMTLNAQASIDMIIRNLFERTADVGFLATDDDLVEFLTKEQVTEQEQTFIEHRIQEYVAKYSVYDDIVLLNPQGEVRAKLNENNPVTISSDPLIQQALRTQEAYIEIYRHSDIFPNKTQSLIYAKRIENQGQAVGVLCMSFEFSEEMEGIFNTLIKETPGYELMLLDESGKVIAANSETQSSLGKQVTEPRQDTAPKMSAQGLEFCTLTHGYQGFKGLKWYGYAKAGYQTAFQKGKEEASIEVEINHDSSIYLHDLEEMNLKVSTLLLIVILNGKITSLKRDVKAFLPVLDSFQDISQNIQEIFDDFIHHIHQVLVKTIITKVEFSASLAVEVMDRNLYERANDCRWWALNSTFRELLTKHAESTTLQVQETDELHKILKYINDLYTVYTNIMLYDARGKILAVSNPDESYLVGTQLPQQSVITDCLKLDSTQKYTVSKFEQTDLYSDRHTYVYHAPVKHWEQPNKNVGGIALVFDSEPEFQAMLQETEPKYLNKEINEATHCLFTTPAGEIISSSSDRFSVGQQLVLPSSLKELPNGKSGAIEWQYEGKKCIVGYKLSEGYREYKVNDGYQNDILAMVITFIE